MFQSVKQYISNILNDGNTEGYKTFKI